LTDMKTRTQFPADAVTRGTLFDHARTQGLAQDLADRVELAVKRKEAKRRTLHRSIGALILILGFSLWGVPYFRSTGTVVTQVANRQTLALSDGSFADLNAQTQLRADFRYGRRAVKLSTGEAFFTVVEDSEHPFMVETPSGIVRVTGTRFNVRILENQQIEVTLVDGTVEVKAALPKAAPGEPDIARLSPGQQFTSNDGRIHTLTACHVENVTAWREGRLVLDEMTVSDAVTRIARYHGKQMEVAPEIASIRLGGSCSLDDLPAFLQSLRATQAIDIVLAGDGSYRIRAVRP